MLVVTGVHGGVQVVAVIYRLGAAYHPARQCKVFSAGKIAVVGFGVYRPPYRFLGHAYRHDAPINFQGL